MEIMDKVSVILDKYLLHVGKKVLKKNPAKPLPTVRCVAVALLRIS